VSRVILENGKAAGVEIFDGRIIKAKVIASSLDPHNTFNKLVGKENLPEDLKSSVEKWKWDKWSLFSVHVALNEPPQYAVDDKQLNGSFVNIIGLESHEDVLSFFGNIMKGEMNKIGGHTTCETLFDPTLSRMPGKHTAFFQMPAPYNLRGGWENRQDEITKAALKVWGEYAPNIKDSNLLMTVSETPLDIERRIASMIKGSIKHGDYNPLQMGYFRPSDTCSVSKTPIDNLYLCGASMYPGGLIIGGPGYIAANVIIDDLGVKKWWKIPDKIKKFVETYIK